MNTLKKLKDMNKKEQSKCYCMFLSEGCQENKESFIKAWGDYEFFSASGLLYEC